MTDEDWQDPFDGDVLEPFETYDGIRFDGLTFDGMHAGNIKLLECLVRRTTWENVNCARSAFTDSTIADARFVAADLSDCQWRDVRVTDTLIAGVTFAGGNLRRMAFSDCKLIGANLRSAQLAEVTFERCVITEMDLTEATVTATSFRQCEIGGLDITKAKLDGVDFRSSELEIARGHAALKGAIVDINQLMSLAPGIAQALGLRVEQ
jgi:uncharacterized protein YjbI with pentapeptide repeats